MQNKNNTSEYEIEYTLIATVKIKIKAENINDAYKKATSVTNLSKITTDVEKNINTDNLFINKITNMDKTETFDFENNFDEFTNFFSDKPSYNDNCD